MSSHNQTRMSYKVSQNYWTKRKKHSMHGTQEQHSEITRLLTQISAEYEAAQRGLFGLASGTSKHAFITQKMENMELCRQELQHIVGEMPAIAMIAEQLNACDDSGQPVQSSLQPSPYHFSLIPSVL